MNAISFRTLKLNTNYAEDTSKSNDFKTNCSNKITTKGNAVYVCRNFGKKLPHQKYRIGRGANLKGSASNILDTPRVPIGRPPAVWGILCQMASVRGDHRWWRKLVFAVFYSGR